MQTRVQVKGLFFTSEKVMKATNRKTRRVFARFGGFVRSVARRSIKKATRKRTASAAGQPPLNRTGLLKDNIFFSYEPETKSVVIGPVRLERVRDNGRVPKLLEEGGDIVRDGVVAHYEPHPFMKPAFAIGVRDNLPQQWQRIAFN